MWPSFSFRDVWHHEHAYAFTVAKAMEVDLLEVIRAEIDKAIAEDRTLRQFQEGLTPILQKRDWWGKKEMEDPKTGEIVRAQLGSPRRLRTIYESNLRAARAAGQWDRAQRTKTTHPYFLYELGPGEKHQDEHEAWAGTILPVDDPWWNDHFPPNGWDCECRVRQISRRDAERRGGATARPPRKAEKMTNPRTGMRFEVDEGLDPAWASNPGKYRGPVLMEHLIAQIEGDPPTGSAILDRVLGGPIFAGFQIEPEGDLPVGLLDHGVRTWLGSSTPLVRLPARIMEKQEGRHSDPTRHSGHKELPADAYRHLPQIMGNPAAVFVSHVTRPEDRRHRLNLFGKVNGKGYLAVVERNPGTDKVELISFRRSRRPKEIGSMLRRALEIIRNPTP